MPNEFSTTHTKKEWILLWNSLQLVTPSSTVTTIKLVCTIHFQAKLVYMHLSNYELLPCQLEAIVAVRYRRQLHILTHNASVSIFSTWASIRSVDESSTLSCWIWGVTGSLHQRVIVCYLSRPMMMMMMMMMMSLRPHWMMMIDGLISRGRHLHGWGHI